MPPETRNLRFVVTAVDGGYDVDLRKCAAEGIVLTGRLKGVDREKLVFQDDLNKTLAEGDAWYAKFMQKMGDYADRCHPPLPQEESRLQHEPSRLRDPERPLEIDVRSAGIASVLWASGYACDFSWIKIPVLDASGDPIHERGVTDRAGLYFLGLRRTHSLASALVAGVGNDAAHISDHIASRRGS